MENILSQFMAENQKKLHIVMFPWLAFGHMIPFLKLSKLIAQNGHKVTFISTPRNIERLPIHTSPLINFIKIPLPEIDGLPKGAESTMDLPSNKVRYLKIAYDGLKEPISEFLYTSSPDWVFLDFVPYWLPPIATKLSISSAYFSIFPAHSLAFLGPVPVLMGTEEHWTKLEDFTITPKWITFETTLAHRHFEVLGISNDFVEGGEGNMHDLQRLGNIIQDCNSIIIRSCSEFQPEWFQLVQELHKKPVLPSGLLPEVADTCAEMTWREINEWLNKHDKKSVVYVAFGSEAILSPEALTELALGIELSEIPFFWVLRKQGNSHELPPGFLERTKGRGLVWTSWAPQSKILSHDSLGGFLNHGGWSSLIEGIQFGVPLIIFTTVADSGLSARLLEEKKLGYELPRDEFDGSFNRGTVAESLKLVMMKEEGKIYRENAKEMSKLFGDTNKQDGYINKLLHHLQIQRCKRK